MEGYNGIKKKVRRVTALTEIEAEDEYRVAFGVVQLLECMKEFPEAGKSYHIITGGAVDLLSHLQWVLLHKKKINHLFLSCWAISGRDILLLEKWHYQGLIGDVEIVVGDVYPSKYKFEWQKLQQMNEAGIVRKVYKGTIHAKVMLCDCADGDKVVIESSANCNINPRVEQACVTVSAKLFDFYRVYFCDLLDEDMMRGVAKQLVKHLRDE